MTPSARPSILVVENERTYIEIYQELLQEHYMLTFAVSLKEAENVLSKMEFDLAIIDPSLDDRDNTNRDGIIVIKKIATLDSPFPVIVVTADSNRVHDPYLRGFIAEVIEKGDSTRHIIDAIQRSLKIVQAQSRWLSLSQQTSGESGYEALKQSLSQLLTLTSADVAHLLVPTENEKELAIIVDTGHDEGRTVNVQDSVTGGVYSTGSISRINNTDEYPHYQPVKGPHGLQRMKSELAVPVLGGDKRIGVLNLESKRSEAFHEPQETLARAFAEMAVLLAKSERRQNESAQFRNFTRHLLKSVVVQNGVWPSILERGLALINARVGYFARKRREQPFRIEVATPPYESGWPLPIRTSVAGLAVESGLPQRLLNARSDPRTRAFRDSLGASSVSILAVPVWLDGEIVGVLNFESDDEHSFTIEHEKLILFLADYASLAIRMERYSRAQADFEGKQKQNALAGHLLHNAGTPICDLRDLIELLHHDELDILQQQHPKIFEVFSYISKQIPVLLSTIDQLSDLITEQDTSRALHSTDVNGIIRAALAEVSLYESKGDISIIDDLMDNLPSVLADRDLKDVFIQLIRNSMMAIDSSGTIRIGTEFQDGKVLVRVSDTGRGMSPLVRQHIFDQGFTTQQNSMKIHGLGLGLCKQYIEKLCKGWIFVEETVEGQGTTIAIVLPVEEDAQ